MTENYAVSIGQVVAQRIATTSHDFSPENVRAVATQANQLTPWLTEAVIDYVDSVAGPDFLEARNRVSSEQQHRAAMDDARYTRGH